MQALRVRSLVLQPLFDLLRQRCILLEHCDVRCSTVSHMSGIVRSCKCLEHENFDRLESLRSRQPALRTSPDAFSQVVQSVTLLLHNIPSDHVTRRLNSILILLFIFGEMKFLQRQPTWKSLILHFGITIAMIDKLPPPARSEVPEELVWRILFRVTGYQHVAQEEREAWYIAQGFPYNTLVRRPVTLDLDPQSIRSVFPNLETLRAVVVSHSIPAHL